MCNLCKHTTQTLHLDLEQAPSPPTPGWVVDDLHRQLKEALAAARPVQKDIEAKVGAARQAGRSEGYLAGLSEAWDVANDMRSKDYLKDGRGTPPEEVVGFYAATGGICDEIDRMMRDHKKATT